MDMDTILQENEEIAAENTALKQCITDLKKEIDCLMSYLLDKTASNCVLAFSDGHYNESIRQCCIDLQGMNVGIKNIKPAIESVLKHIVGVTPERLPHYTTCSRMLIETKALALQQIYKEVGEDDNACLHSDGTSKFRRHYSSYQLSTEKSSYSIGLQEIACGTAANTLETLKWIIQDIELVAEQDAGIKVLASIKNTMSDCAGKFWRIISLTYFQQLLKTG
jgi:hypothetical protein